MQAAGDRQPDCHLQKWISLDGCFVVGSEVQARFRAKEPEPQPPMGFEVQYVNFGGEYLTVTYTVTTEGIEVGPDLFYRSSAAERAAAEFAAYRQAILDFAAYRRRLIASLRRGRR